MSLLEREIAALDPFLAEAIERPAPALVKSTSAIVLTLLGFGALFTCIAEVDVVAEATGAIVADNHQQTGKFLVSGIVARVAVKEGDLVQRGAVLVELDREKAWQDREHARHRALEATSELAMWQALDSADPVTAYEEGQRDDEPWLQTRTLLIATLDNQRAAIRKLQAQIDASDKKIMALEEALQTQRAAERIREQRLNDKRDLYGRGIATKIETLSAEENYLQQRARADQDKSQITIEIANRAALDEALVQANTEFRRTVLDKYKAARIKVIEAEQDYARIEEQYVRMVITAEEDSIVASLKVHTAGSAVTPGDEVVTLVSRQREKLALADIDPKDVGFIAVGQPVDLKLDTYPYTKYGMVQGELVSIAGGSGDASTSTRAYVRLKESVLRYRGSELQILPGMKVTCDVRLARRTIADYLISTLMRTPFEAFRER